MKEKVYYPIDKETKEILSPVKAEYRGGIHHIPRDALESEPLPSKQGFAVVAVLDESGKAIDSEYIEDHRGKAIYDESDCTKSEDVSELGPIKKGFTPDKPQTEFDERINDAWVTNESNKYIAEYNQVDDARRAAYFQVVTPLIDEAKIKRDLIKTPEAIAEADELDKHILAARQKIQTENPWPTPPTN
ncbi:hypothetical protein [Vibrio sp. Isolate24]|uniref:hypothetical protein n=1 Tax=Vibrio sp. Isolate24 TaxID=2908534 RepID=UPI001EFEC71F|nr:hypothetical protein [Vibrio sp. Isolate24]MCG9678752.1 hypothetical protein [Vibrio sp. Isolate24]